ncbi:MAG TPA: septal ring lytic transglycosylase RlpA family protein [Rubrobacteraceae bacterium]|nr:septal ring lytic transglycosylase RlpA family protein [Rubrobacteraceae bacterium]
MLYRLSRYGLWKLFWIALLMCAFVALGTDRAEAEEVLASWYGPGFEGLPTASGETFDPYGYTAAHNTLPLGTQLTVSYNGYSVPVTVNDRGPYIGAREIDLSQGAAESIGLTHAGVDYVDLVVTDYGYEQSYTTDEYATTDYYAPQDPVYSGGADYSATPSGGAYQVQSGDTLSGIAATLGTTVDDLAAANGIANPDVLSAGQTLYY